MTRLFSGFIAITVVMGLLLAPAASSEPESPPTTPAMPRSMIIIGADVAHAPAVKGTVIMVARTPAEAAIKSIRYLVDGTEVGQAASRPFRLSWNSLSKPDGKYTVKAIALGDAGQEVWSGESQIEVVNKSEAQPSLLPPVINGPPPSSEHPLPPAFPGNRGPGDIRPPGPDGLPSLPPEAAGNDGWKSYSNRQHRFTVQHPATAAVEDNSAKMTPKKAGAFWIAFTQQADQQPEYVLNVRYNKLNSPSTPEDYAKYNTYLLDWERVTINGMSGFGTMSGNQAAKTIIHRTLLVDDSSVWMLNLTDVTGNDPQITKAIFDRFVRSLRPGHVEVNERPAPRQPKVAPAPPAPAPEPEPRPVPPAPEPAPEPQPQPEPPPAAEPQHSDDDHENDQPASEPTPEPPPSPDQEPAGSSAPDNSVEHQPEPDADTEPDAGPTP